MSTPNPWRSLSIEDRLKDSRLIQTLLEAEDTIYEATRFDAQRALITSLSQSEIDLNLADYAPP